MLLSLPSLSSLLLLAANSPSLVLGLPSYLVPYRDANDLFTRGSASPSNATGAALSSYQMCGTKQPNSAFREVHAALLQDPGVLPRLMSTTDPRPHLDKRQTSNGQIEIQVYVHIVTTWDQAHLYSTNVRTSVIQNQIFALNQAYSHANINFVRKATSFTIRDDWATDANSTAMKQNLRRGTYQDLNLYFQSNLSSSPGTRSAQVLLGYCTLPTTITYGNPPTEYPAVDYATDGCNILMGTMPTVPHPVYGYSQGKTAVHEIGHWFGLLHTFQDNTCQSGDPGDYINDTPQESISTSGCPTGKDSCPNSPGMDPVNNYMDYSDDACYTQFTANQISRMHNMFTLYRAGY